MLGDDGNRYVSAHFGRKIFLNNQGTKQPGRQTLFFCCFDVQSLRHPHSAFRIPHSAFRTGKALFRYSFWDGRLGRMDLTQRRQGAKSRSDTTTIAQPFMAGSGVNQMEKSREGRQNGSFVPDGTLEICGPRVPAMNGWAIFEGARNGARMPLGQRGAGLAL